MLYNRRQMIQAAMQQSPRTKFCGGCYHPMKVEETSVTIKLTCVNPDCLHLHNEIIVKV
jgi:hypothetical protein